MTADPSRPVGHTWPLPTLEHALAVAASLRPAACSWDPDIDVLVLEFDRPGKRRMVVTISVPE